MISSGSVCLPLGSFRVSSSDRHQTISHGVSATASPFALEPLAQCRCDGGRKGFSGHARQLGRQPMGLVVLDVQVHHVVSRGRKHLKLYHCVCGTASSAMRAKRRGEPAATETMDAWRTCCPRVPVWEDAVNSGLVERVEVGQKALVQLTGAGRRLLKQARHATDGASMNHGENL